MKETLYQVHEIFRSIDGEVNPWHQGVPSIFIRLQGCNQHCSYCDAGRAQEKGGGVRLICSSVLDQVERLRSKTGTQKVTITGGEPLLQDIKDLVWELVQCGMYVSIETNGTVVPFDVDKVSEMWWGHKHVSFIVDVKLPSSGVDETCVDWKWITNVVALDNTWLKFVVSDVVDFNIAKEYITQYKLPISKCAFSPVHGKMNANVLLDLMLGAGFGKSILNIQIHKYINMS